MEEAYERVRLVGRGAFGTVYLCRRKDDQAQVIVKEIGTEWSESERRAGMAEAELMASLAHPFIVAYHHSFLHQRALHIVMEYARHGTLAEWLAGRRGCLVSEAEAGRLLAQLALALHYLHSKAILHRDLKTQNVLLRRLSPLHAVVSDFGIARVVGSVAAQTVVGTPNYMSPEMCQGQAYGPPGDIWSFGCVAVEVLSLRRAFEATSLNALVVRICAGSLSAPSLSPTFSAALRQLVHRCLALRPAHRPKTGEVLGSPALLPALLDLLGSHGAVRPPSPRSPADSPTEGPVHQPPPPHQPTTLSLPDQPAMARQEQSLLPKPQSPPRSSRSKSPTPEELEASILDIQL